MYRVAHTNPPRAEVPHQQVILFGMDLLRMGYAVVSYDDLARSVDAVRRYVEKGLVCVQDMSKTGAPLVELDVLFPPEVEAPTPEPEEPDAELDDEDGGEPVPADSSSDDGADAAADESVGDEPPPAPPEEPEEEEAPEEPAPVVDEEPEVPAEEPAPEPAPEPEPEEEEDDSEDEDEEGDAGEGRSERRSERKQLRQLKELIVEDLGKPSLKEILELGCSPAQSAPRSRKDCVELIHKILDGEVEGVTADLDGITELLSE